MVGCPECPTDVGDQIGTASNWLQLALQYHISTLEYVLNSNLPMANMASRQEFVGALLDNPGSFDVGTLGVTVTSVGNAAP